MILKKLDLSDIEEIKALFADVFTGEPWNDDWSDERQLDRYIRDLTGQSNSLTFGGYSDARLIALSMGYIKHWYTGTEYIINELCVAREMQGRGIGTSFLTDIEKYLIDNGMTHIFLLTERDVPAYEFYKKNGFVELENSVAFSKRLG